jgi:hypothetical protein
MKTYDLVPRVTNDCSNIVSMLELYLAKAKAGDLNAIAFAMVDRSPGFRSIRTAWAFAHIDGVTTFEDNNTLSAAMTLLQGRYMRDCLMEDLVPPSDEPA